MLPSHQLGPYVLMERLASGGMAEVFLAEQERESGLRRTVALKMVLPQFSNNPQSRNMILDEARTGFRLRHQNIVQILDVGRENDRLFIAMEFVRGLDLARLSSYSLQSRPPYELVSYIGTQVLAALAYAHDLREDGEHVGVVHRDVSPQNILISDAGEVKLTDFGIALARDRITQTTTGTVKGKLAYMAPEQAKCEPVDARADLFSIGAVLYELLADRPPFAGDSEIAMLRSIEQGDVPSLCELRPDLPQTLCAVIDRSVAYHPNDRWASAGEFRSALEPFARGAAAAEDELRRYVGNAQDSLEEDRKHERVFEDALFKAREPEGNRTEAVRAETGRRPRWILPLLGGLVVMIAFALLWFQADSGAKQVVAEVKDATVVLAPTTDAGQREAPDAGVEKADAEPLEPPEHKDSKQRSRAKYGSVSIAAFPWAEVRVDGVHIGNTPIRNKRMFVGKHKVLLTNPTSGKTVRRVIRVRPNKTTQLRVEL